MSANWHPSIPLSELPEGKGKLVRIEGKALALFRVEDAVYATDNQCPHEGYPLADGSIQDGILTCNWHNWKFKLDNGTCLFGGEDVGTYPTEIRDGIVHINITDPPPEDVIPGRRQSLRAALDDMDTSRMARDVVRLLQLGMSPQEILLDAATHGADHAEYGWNHSLAVVSECARLAPRFEGLEAAIPLTQAFRAVSEENLRLPPRPHPGPVSVEKFADADAMFTELRDFMEKGRLEEAEALFRGAIEAGVPAPELRRWLNTLATDHFLAFGHALIYVTKAFEMLDALGEDVIPRVFPALIPEIGYATREDLLPYMRTYMKSMNNALDQLPAQVTKQQSPLTAFDEASFRRALLDGSQQDTFAATFDALSAGVAVDRILDATVLAASERLLRFDPDKDWVTEKDFGWLQVTHNLTYANAVRKTCRSMMSTDTLRGVYFSTWFVNRTRKLDGTPPSLEGVEKTGSLETRLRGAIRDHDLQGMVSHAADACAQPGGAEDLGALLVRLSLEDYAGAQIFVDHLIKTSVAAAEEAQGMAKHPDGRLPLLAASRLLAADRRERGVRRQVHFAVDFVVHGRPSETI